jgi:hypothetical protein
MFLQLIYSPVLEYKGIPLESLISASRTVIVDSYEWLVPALADF